MKVSGVSAFSAALFCLSMEARAATIVEYFNDYGITNSTLVGKNGGSGWLGAWTGNANTYVAGSQVAYGGSGYSATGNENGSNDGAATGTVTSSISYRNFTGLTGTIWISATVRQTAISNDTLLWLDKTTTATTGDDREFVALRGSTGKSSPTGPPEPVIAYNNSDDSANNTALTINTSHLILLRIDMNYSLALDRIRFWVDPDLSGGEAGLGLTTASTNGPKYLKESADAYGLTFDGVGVSFNSTGNTLDAIRISNEANGFTFVTTGVPEPGSALLLLLGAAGFLGARRRG